MTTISADHQNSPLSKRFSGINTSTIYGGDSISTRITAKAASVDNYYAQALAKVPIIPHDDCGGQGPGPYILPPVIGYKDHDITKYRSPAYSIGVKRPDRNPDNITPGPDYETTGWTHHGKANPPKATIKSRPPTESVYGSQLTPGPGKYNPEKFPNAVFRRAPLATIKGRTFKRFDVEVPGPKYEAERVMGPRLPIRISAPSATLKSRLKDFSAYGETGPGPGYYNPGDPATRRAPAISIGSKWPGPSIYVTEEIPGPGAYHPNRSFYGRRAPRAFLGVKHSKCKRPLMTEEDNYSLVDF